MTVWTWVITVALVASLLTIGGCIGYVLGRLRVARAWGLPFQWWVP